MIYRAIPGSKLNNKEAQVVGEALEQMGSFTPTDVVEAARPDTSPLHEHFEWDDLKAAEKYRLHEARQIVSHIAVIVKVNGRDTQTRAFHSISVQDGNSEVEHRYTAIKIVSANPDMREQVIQKAMIELEGWQKRHEQYADIFGEDLFQEIKKTTQRIRKDRTVEAQPTA